ncbi:IS66 family transposase [Paenibacillus agaridevorans]|uniref:IS66 family transposase n=1 Tax=Paenibacillus agaridevorans TaxID=171404 RepID=UPI003CCE6E86
MVGLPDTIVTHPLLQCTRCSSSLEDTACQGYERRQVFDLPQPRFVVTEHRTEKKCCPHSHSLEQATFPSEIRGPVQFGQGIAAWTVYLSMYQMLPLERIGQLFADLTGHRPSKATLLAHLQTMHTKLIPHEQAVRDQLLASPVGHADETSVKVEGRNHWLHTMSTAN